MSEFIKYLFVQGIGVFPEKVLAWIGGTGSDMRARDAATSSDQFWQGVGKLSGDKKAHNDNVQAISGNAAEKAANKTLTKGSDFNAAFLRKIVRKKTIIIGFYLMYFLHENCNPFIKYRWFLL